MAVTIPLLMLQVGKTNMIRHNTQTGIWTIELSDIEREFINAGYVHYPLDWTIISAIRRKYPVTGLDATMDNVLVCGVVREDWTTLKAILSASKVIQASVLPYKPYMVELSAAYPLPMSLDRQRVYAGYGGGGS